MEDAEGTLEFQQVRKLLAQEDMTPSRNLNSCIKGPTWPLFEFVVRVDCIFVLLFDIVFISMSDSRPHWHFCTPHITSRAV